MSSESLPLRPFAIRICAIIMTATLFTACGPGAKKRALSEQLKSHIRSINTGGNSAIEDEPVHNPDYIVTPDYLWEFNSFIIPCESHLP